MIRIMRGVAARTVLRLLCLRRPRGSAGVPRQTHTPHRALRAGRLDRRDLPHLRAAPDRNPRPAGGHRQPPGRGIDDRAGHRREVASRRLHGRASNNIAYGANPSIYRKMPFDSEKDLVPVDARLDRDARRVGASVDPRALDQGADRARPIEARRRSTTGRPATAALTISRPRASRTWRSIEAPARPVQRRRPRGDLDRPGRDDHAVRDDSLVDPAFQDRQARPARR